MRFFAEHGPPGQAQARVPCVGWSMQTARTFPNGYFAGDKSTVETVGKLPDVCVTYK